MFEALVKKNSPSAMLPPVTYRVHVPETFVYIFFLDKLKGSNVAYKYYMRFFNMLKLEQFIGTRILHVPKK